MINLSAEEFNAWAGGAKVLRDDGKGNQVLLTGDDRIIRLTRARRLLDSTFKRFAANANELKTLGIRSPDIDGVFRCRSEHATLVMYKRLEQDTIRNLLNSDSPPGDMVTRLSAFLAELHDKGVFSSALDLGGIVYAGDMPYALVELKDLQIITSPLTIRRRIAAIATLLSPGADRQVLMDYGLDRFLSEYLDHAGLDHGDRIALVHKLPEHLSDPEPVRAVCESLINRSPHPG